MLNKRPYEQLSIYHFVSLRDCILNYKLSLIVSDLFMMNFVYTLCSLAPLMVKFSMADLKGNLRKKVETRFVTKYIRILYYYSFFGLVASQEYE